MDPTIAASTEARLAVIDIALASHRSRYLACLDAGHGMECDFYEDQIDALLAERFLLAPTPLPA